jgi:hypothetical protein
MLQILFIVVITCATTYTPTLRGEYLKNLVEHGADVISIITLTYYEKVDLLHNLMF